MEVQHAGLPRPRPRSWPLGVELAESPVLVPLRVRAFLPPPPASRSPRPPAPPTPPLCEESSGAELILFDKTRAWEPRPLPEEGAPSWRWGPRARTEGCDETHLSAGPSPRCLPGSKSSRGPCTWSTLTPRPVASELAPLPFRCPGPASTPWGATQSTRAACTQDPHAGPPCTPCRPRSCRGADVGSPSRKGRCSPGLQHPECTALLL